MGVKALNITYLDLRRFWYIVLFGLINTGMAQDIEIRPLKIEAKKVEVAEHPTQLIGPSVLRIPGYFVWGGSVISGDDGKYHMLFSLWESGPGTDRFTQSWVLESKIGYAVSDEPDRNFEFKKIVLKGARYDGNTEAWDAQMVHNPHIKSFNGNYYLYYMGSRDPGKQPKGSTGENLDSRSRVQQSQCIGVIAFTSFDELLTGNFKRPKKPLLSPRTRVKAEKVVNGSPKGTVAKPDNIIVTNPSVTYDPGTKKYLLFFKGNLYEPHWKGVHGVAFGNSPTGPFTPHDKFVFDIKMPDGSLASTEDPYVWHSQKYDRFFAVVKDFSGRVSGFKSGLALLESKDGLDWHRAKNPLFMKRQLLLSDNSKLSVDRLERPQLLLDTEGIPQFLYAACSVDNVNPKNDGSSCNVHIPLEIVRKK